jgi:DNA-binding IclR family transcriptional regulator
MQQSGGRTVRSTENACQILDELRTRSTAGVTELADALDYAPSAVHAQLNTLQDCGFVRKDGTEYRLSFTMLEFTQSILDQFGDFDAIRSEIDTLARNCDEVAQFGTNEGGRIVHLHKSKGDSAVETGSFLGKRERLHCTGLGKAILSTMDEAEIDELLHASDLPRKTGNTITTREELLDELEAIRSRGYAIDDEENVRGLRCVAMPIMASPDENLGAISITGPISRMTDDRIESELVDLLSKSANIIELNYKFA